MFDLVGYVRDLKLGNILSDTGFHTGFPHWAGTRLFWDVDDLVGDGVVGSGENTEDRSQNEAGAKLGGFPMPRGDGVSRRRRSLGLRYRLGPSRAGMSAGFPGAGSVSD